MERKIIIQLPDGKVRQGLYFAAENDITLWQAHNKLKNIKIILGVGLAVALTVRLMH